MTASQLRTAAHIARTWEPRHDVLAVVTDDNKAVVVRLWHYGNKATVTIGTTDVMTITKGLDRYQKRLIDAQNATRKRGVEVVRADVEQIA